MQSISVLIQATKETNEIITILIIIIIIMEMYIHQGATGKEKRREKGKSKFKPLTRCVRGTRRRREKNLFNG